MPQPSALESARSAFWTTPNDRLLAMLHSSDRGLAAGEAAARLAAEGPNSSALQSRPGLGTRFARKLVEPLVAILLCAAAVSGLLGDWPSFVIIALVVTVSVSLDVWQEHQAETTADALKRSVALKAAVRRDGQTIQLPVEDLVTGDIVELSAGDLVPADGVVIASAGCQTNEALLTGEPFPSEKRPGPSDASELALAFNALFAGTSVVTGTALMLVTATGPRTRLGHIASALTDERPPTAFERGLRELGNVILRLTVGLVLFVVLAHVAMGRGVMETLLFSVALAVGLTPELLPMVMTVTLSRGALRMASRRVVVKRLSAIHDLGSMDVLCTDKTGTLTEAKIQLTAHPGVDGTDSPRVLTLARLNSTFSAGVRTPLDDAILSGPSQEPESDWRRIAELPFDFVRRRASVFIANATGRILVVKGASEEVLLQCTFVEMLDGSVVPLDGTWRHRLSLMEEARAKDGYRLLGIAWRSLEDTRTDVTAADEAELVFVGFAAFLDPPKPSATLAIERLERLGVAVKVISGDAEPVVRHVASSLAIPFSGVLTGADITKLNDTALAARVDDVDLFARVSPDQKTRIVRALQARGRTVGFLGDGVNDAPSIRAADVGLSVDGATEAARGAADMILLAPDLGIVGDGVEEGRKTYHNIMKYVRMGTSSNFGNMLSMAVASLALPFLPLTAVQILLNNLLYDISEIGIPFDRVDAESLMRPRHWDMRDVVRFTLIMGPLSSLFDIATFGILLHVFKVGAEAFRTAWFAESIATQVAVVFVIRTAKPVWSSRPHPALVATCAGTIAFVLALLLTPAGAIFGFVPLPPPIWIAIGGLAVAYLTAAELLKRFALGLPPRSQPFVATPAPILPGALMTAKADPRPRMSAPEAAARRPEPTGPERAGPSGPPGGQGDP